MESEITSDDDQLRQDEKNICEQTKSREEWKRREDLDEKTKLRELWKRREDLGGYWY